MNVGTRHRPAPNQGRAAFALMSVIALLALTCFPVFAHAECVSSSCIQYTESIPKAEGEHAKSHDQGTPATKSNTPQGGTNPPSKTKGSEGTGGSPEGESSKEGGVTPNGNNHGTGQGNQAGSPNSGAKNALHPNGQGQPASKSSSGSSPLVPILIAIALLAAISVAVVMIRQRRQAGDSGPTGSPSPEAN